MTATVWPDWTGKAVAVVASGPSAKKAGVAALKGVLPVLAIKRSVDLAPFADVVYGCDFPFWQSVNGLPDFMGLKLAFDPRACDQFGCGKIEIPDRRCDRMLFDKVGVVGAGGNSGFQAINWVAQCGADRILAIGFDMHDRGGTHWYGRNIGFRMANPTEESFRRWRPALDQAALDLAARGIEVVNASPVSDLKGFRQGGVAETLERWGLA